MKPRDPLDLYNVEAMQITTPEEAKVIRERLNEAMKIKEMRAKAWLAKQN